MRTYKKNKRKRQRRYKGGRPERHTNKSKRQFSKREKRIQPSRQRHMLKPKDVEQLQKGNTKKIFAQEKNVPMDAIQGVGFGGHEIQL